MKPNKLHFPFFFTALLILLLFSCGQKETTKEEDIEGSTLIDKGDAFLKLKDKKYDSAFYNYYKATELSKSTDNKVRALIRLANLQLDQCGFIEAEASVTDAIKANKNPIYDYYIYNTLGIAYEEQYNFDAAIENYNKSYASGKGIIDKLTIKNNIGVVYLEQKDFKKAQWVLEKAISNDSLKENPRLYAKIADNLGYAFFKQNNAKGYDLLNESLKIRDSLKNHEELIASYIHLSEYYKDSNPALAVEMAQKAYQSAKVVNSPDDKIEALTFWIASTEPVEAKKLALQQLSISDSINRIRQTTKNQFAKIKYDSKKNIEKQQQYKANMWIALTIALLVLIVAFVVVDYIQKRNRKRLKASVHETESRIAKKIHDELANDTYQTMAFAKTQNFRDDESKEALLDKLESIYNKARDISQTSSEIYTDARYGNFLLDLINSFNGNEVNIIQNVNSVDWSKISEEAKIALYRVVQELLVNLEKHSGADLATFIFNNQPKSIVLKYSDNGKGINPDKFSKKGLHNAENRIKALKGTFTFDKGTTKGFKVSIQIPK